MALKETRADERCVRVCVCLGLRGARQLATGATPAQTGVGSLHDRLSSQMVNWAEWKPIWLACWLSGWLGGSLAVWVGELCLVTTKPVKEQGKLCFLILWGSFSSLSFSFLKIWLLGPFAFGINFCTKGLYSSMYFSSDHCSHYRLRHWQITMVDKEEWCACIIPTWMQHESLFSCQKTLVTCRHGAIWWWVKCSDVLGNMIQLRHIMYLLLDLAWISTFLKQHCGGGKRRATLSFLRINQYRATVEPVAFFSSHWKSYNPCEIISKPQWEKKHPNSYRTFQLPHQCCQSSRHIITEVQVQPASCGQTAHHLRERDETHFIMLPNSKGHQICLARTDKT